MTYVSKEEVTKSVVTDYFCSTNESFQFDKAKINSLSEISSNLKFLDIF